jgi:indolepyruvate ferredoxin oxidoreductase
MEQERRLHGPKMAAVGAFARANAIDRIMLDPKPARLGIITTGKAYLDVRQALDDLGLDDRAAAALGIRLYKVGLTWPLETEGARRFAEGLAEVLVVEEKRGFIEDQLVRILYNLDTTRRPRVVGKRDEHGAVLLPSEGEISPTHAARAIVARLAGLGEKDATFRRAACASRSVRARRGYGGTWSRAHPLLLLGMSAQHIDATARGQPRIRRDRLPRNGDAGSGPQDDALNAHGRRRRTWIGQAPFTTEKHVFQNLGDGTYQHSGLLAIRAAAIADVNITYKILYNDAVAMTGGQLVEGHPGVAEITRQVAAEGAKKVVVVTDEPGKYPANAGFAAGVEIHDRSHLDRVQRELREIPGLTVLVYDQTCAAEKRRRRKRGTLSEPTKRVVINEAVCEGCGDCSVKSNCISVRPLETEFGRKRTIDQSNCNKDYSCIEGFCPSFVTVHGGRLRRIEPRAADTNGDPSAGLPLPTPAPLVAPYGMLITGIGGTGVLTVGALIGMAAHLEGKGCTVLDFTGLAQKNGAVMSHVRLAPTQEALHAVRVAVGGADLVLGCDIVVAAGPAALTRIAHGSTHAIVNRDLQATSAFVIDGDVDFEAPQMEQAIVGAAGADNVEFVGATRIATALIGDSIATNLFMLGYAFQKGRVPLGLAALERAIELNGIAVDEAKRTFAWGRLAAHDPACVDALVRPMTPVAPSPKNLAALIEHRAAFLARYQDDAYAQRYRAFVAEIAKTEALRAKGRSGLAEAVAQSLFKLMAYKDEYEVARLYTDGAFNDALQRQFEGSYRLEFHLAPPLLARRDRETGHLVKRVYGRWMLRAFALLARARRLRGTRFDPFGRTAERRMERRLIIEYESLMRELAAHLDPVNHALAVEIAALPMRIRGFGHVKERNVAEVKAREASLVETFRRPVPQPQEEYAR